VPDVSASLDAVSAAAPAPKPTPVNDPPSIKMRTVADRVNNRKPAYDGTPNYSEEGQATKGVAIDTAIQIDDELAAGQLRELAELQTEVNAATSTYNVKKDAAAVAKKTVESKTELLLEKLRLFTHPPSLPLFDQTQHNRDVTRMLDADKDAKDQATGEGMPESPEETGEVVDCEVPAGLDVDEPAEVGAPA
jgi:hypothetical protein